MLTKIILSLFALLIITTSCNTQISSIVKKTYGFEREVSGGMKQTNDSSNIEKNKLQYQYFLFQEYTGKKQIEVYNIWIKKSLYEFKIEVISTPYLLQEKEIVPSSKNKVIKIMIFDKKETTKMSTSLQKIINENDLVIEGRIGKNKFIRAVQKFSKIDPLLTE